MGNMSNEELKKLIRNVIIINYLIGIFTLSILFIIGLMLIVIIFPIIILEFYSNFLLRRRDFTGLKLSLWLLLLVLVLSISFYILLIPYYNNMELGNVVIVILTLIFIPFFLIIGSISIKIIYHYSELKSLIIESHNSDFEDKNQIKKPSHSYTRYCPSCGNKNTSKNSQYCDICGQGLESKA